MSPIGEKRLQSQSQSHHKQISFPNSYSHDNAFTKEKVVTSKHSKKGLEILDFHESWLEEVEIYRDRLFVHKSKSSAVRISPSKTTQQNNGNGSSPRINTSTNTGSSAVITNSTHEAISSEVPSSESAFISSPRRKSSDIGSAVKSRMFIRSSKTPPSNNVATICAAAIASTPAETKSKNDRGVQRTREEGGKSSANHSSKRHSSQHMNSSSMSTQTLSQNSAKSGGSSSPNRINSNTQPLPIKPPVSKVIVNQFHASKLLSTQQQEEKNHILTQNGLTKSAATAYENSVYASNYLSQDQRNHSSFNSIRNLHGENSSFAGSSMLHTKISENERQHSYGNGVVTTDEDPCAAIDDMTFDTNSDDEEEYIGYPFFLKEDGSETHQSRNIRRNEPRMEDTRSLSDDCEAKMNYFTPETILSPSIFPNVPPYINFSSHACKGPQVPAALHKVLKWKLSPVMPKIVKRVVLNSGFRVIKNTTDWTAIWEKHMKSPGFRTIRSHQKYNHMPGSFRIGRKDTMWRSIETNVKKFGIKEFGFMQKSYVMPDDLETLRQIWPKNASKLTKWIVKPPASARGTGIRIVNKWSQFPKDRPLVVQKYIERPLLINDNKFDMRIYVVLTSINPLRIYMYKDGLARFASVKYSSELHSLDDRCMHLTNYSINKFSENYSKNEDVNACQGHKWTLQSLWCCLESRGVNTKRLWATLRNLVIKAIVSGEAGLNRMYRQNVNFRYNCFELFGFDVLLDENIVPWLLEINISPSLHSELPLDLHVKGPLIQAVLNTALYQVPPKIGDKMQRDLLQELELDGPLCHDKRIFTTCLTAEEVRKHNLFTNRGIELREEYIDTILEHLMPDDVRCLIISEDELARCKPLERVFPTPESHIYLRFIDNPRYYNRLLDAWETKYGSCREEGIELLSRLCSEGYHLQVSDAALEKEPNVALTEIDMLHARKSDDTVVPINVVGAQTYLDGHLKQGLAAAGDTREAKEISKDILNNQATSSVLQVNL